MLKKRTIIFLIACLCTLLLTLIFTPVAARVLWQPASVAIEWWAIDSGGGPASAAPGISIYTTLGQPIVGSSSSQGGLSLEGGWQADSSMSLYLPMLRK